MNGIPEPELLLSIEELASVAGITRTRLATLVRMGVVDPAHPDASTFTAATAARLQRMLRLRCDLGVNMIGAAIILDLIDRLEQTALELAPLRRAL